MSYHLTGDIIAKGYNDSNLSNFVDNCYAKPLDIKLNTSTIALPVAYQYRFHTYELNSSEIADANITDLNDTSINVISMTTADFPGLRNGASNTRLNLNYTREKNATVNPEEIFFNSYTVDCNVTADCTFSADTDGTLISKTTTGTKDLNNTISIKHYYGRTHASRQRYTDNNGTANIYYEVYCFGNDCNKTLLPSLNRTDDIRWFINENHNTSNDGNITAAVVSEKAPNSFVTESSRDIADVSITKVNLSYDDTTRGYPYKTTMENNASEWLIYNEDDPTATRNQFSVEFEKAGTGWSGEHETNTTTTDTGNAKVNRRSMW